MIYFIGNKELVENELYQNSTVEECLKYFSIHTTVALDTETGGFDPYTKSLLTVQLGDKKNQFVIDWNYISNQDKKNIKDFLEKENLTLLIHNAQFDLRFLYRQNIYPKDIYDSFLAEAILYQGYDRGLYPKSLKHCVEKYCGETLNKDIRGQIHWKGLTADVIVYAAKDVAYLHEIKDKQCELLEQQELLSTLRLENEFVKVLSYIVMSGIQIDKEAWITRVKEDEKLLIILENQLNDFILKDESNKYSKYIDSQLDLFSSDLKVNINWNSSKQVIKFFKDLGIDTSTKDKTNGGVKDSVDAKVLLPQLSKDPIIKIYLDYKGQEKTLSTYGMNWIKQINPTTGRIHTQFNQLLDTGRLSSGGKNRDSGDEWLNFLNIPQDNTIRNCIVPKEGYSYIDCDYSGQEQVVLANFSKDPNLIEFYQKNLCDGDMHTFVCKKLNPELENLSLEEIKKNHKDKRHYAKIAGFSINYGGVGATIANNLSIPIEDGNRVYDAYMDAFPGLKDYFTKCKNDTLERGYIITDRVSKRRIFSSNYGKYKELKSKITREFWDEYKIEKAKDSSKFKEMRLLVSTYFKCKGELERKALNFPIQGASASMTKIACIYIFREIEKTKAYERILFPNVVHDQIILEVPDDEIDNWKSIVETSMVKAGDLFCKIIKVKAEAEVLKKWKK